VTRPVVLHRATLSQSGARRQRRATREALRYRPSYERGDSPGGAVSGLKASDLILLE
jgi:hypothetical protein